MDIGLCKFIRGDWIEFAKKYCEAIPNGIHDSIEISNLGVAKLGGADYRVGWSLANLWLAQGRRGFGAAMTVCVVSNISPSDLTGGMNAVMSSFPQAVPKETLLAIGNEWKQEILKFLHAH